MRVICAIAWVGLAVSVSSSEKPPVGFLERYCLDCHDADMAKGEFNLERLLDAEITAHAGEWETVIRRLAAGRCRRLSGSVSQAESSVVGCNPNLRT